MWQTLFTLLFCAVPSSDFEADPAVVYGLKGRATGAASFGSSFALQAISLATLNIPPTMAYNRRIRHFPICLRRAPCETFHLGNQSGFIFPEILPPKA
ncbi:MAG: hypothetical protein AAF368_02100 [Planctomycetota bacterium]